MGESADHDITQLLTAIPHGGQDAINRLLPMVYAELRAVAQTYLQRERPDHTLSATALVHESYLRLVNQREVQWQNRAHFFAIAAQAIRRILVDHARSHQREKRGGDRHRLSLSDVTPSAPQRDIDLIALDEAMERLAMDEPLDARIVEMRFFGGLTVNEIAEVVSLDEKTVRRHWNFAKARLYMEVVKGDLA